MKIFPIILSGGSGKRLWPLSREQFPKQYQTLIGKNSMLQDTILRLEGIENLAEPIIICNSEHRFIVAEQLRQIKILKYTILLEPVARNTAPAIAAAAFNIMQVEENHDAILLILSADHVIEDISAFHDAINIAKSQAEADRLVTFGIVPTNANTSFGYIQTSINNENYLALNVKSFKEKPNINLANKYFNENKKLASQNLSINWYWNSGMFMFKANTLIEELSIHSNTLIEPIKNSVMNAKQDLDFIRLEEDAFASCSNISIDYALMELSNNVVVVTLDAKWSDVGSWSALFEIGDKDKSNNVIKGDVITQETTNSYIYSPNTMVATIGIDNLIIVSTSDAIFIANKDKAKEVKSIVETLRIDGREEANNNRKVYRPWGWFDSIQIGQNFQVKRLHINPRGKLSLQKHHKRSEHWVVISGIATVTVNKKEFLLKEGESTYIEVGAIHSLENRTNKMLEIIEVQNGKYLGEDDIVRFDDNYGRN
jgi:mannose-1-phosphate guanylyltransferase/mannose-6-phosphate isomerase